jgi:TRAP transporter 4TM/12TM fusion protein
MGVLSLLAPGGRREQGPAERAALLVLGLGVGIGLVTIAFGVYADRRTVLYLFLAAILSVAFLTTTGGPSRPRGPSAIAWICVAAAWAASLYFVAMRERHEMRLPIIDSLSFADQLSSVVLILLVLEATRRTIGMTLVTLVTLFLAYGFFGHLLEGPFAHRPLSLEEVIDHLVFTTNGLFGPPLLVACFLVYVFVLFGAILDRVGGGEFFHRLAEALVGRQVGGPAKVAVISSGMYGSISGSPTADVVTTGSITIPLMIRTGYSRVYAGAVESVASTGGAIMPPVMGIAAFMMSDFTGIAYSEIVIASVVPAFIYYLAIYLAVHFHSRRIGLKPTVEGRGERVLTVLAENWLFLVPIGLIVWIVLAVDRPDLSAAVAIAALAVVALIRSRDPVATVARLRDGLGDALTRACGVGVACAVAGLVVGTLSMTDLTGKISSMLFALAPGNLLLTLFIAALVTIVLGMGMPTPAVYALAAVLAGPAIVSLGIATLPAHLFIVFFASMSAITPPVAVAAFAAASIADANPMRIGLLACRIGVVAFLLPFAFVYQPGILLIGETTAVVIQIAAALGAAIALAGAAEAWLGRPIGPAPRIFLGMLGIAMIWPVTGTSLAALSLFAGIALVMLRHR